MPKLNVLFFGLICHVGKDPDKAQADHAVIVKSKDHNPCLLWCGPDGSPQEVELDLKGEEIHIGSLSARPLPFGTSYEKYVVKLRHLLPGQERTIKGSVRRRRNKKDVHAYVVYPFTADKLRVVDVYPQVALHETEEGIPLRIGCVARITMTTVETVGDTVTVGYVENRRWHPLAVVPADGCILFSNAESTLSQYRRVQAEGREGVNAAAVTIARRATMLESHVRHYSAITEDDIDVRVKMLDHIPCPADDEINLPPGCEEWIQPALRALGILANEYVDCGNGGDP